MNVENRVYPEPGQRKGLVEDPAPDGPIVMVNLLKFRDKAKYKELK